jgi:glutathione S-transferase
MIKIYHAKRARSARVIWLLEELGVPYELSVMDFKPEALRSPEHLARHPLGQLPVVELDGVRFFESGAHVQLLLERFGQGRLEPALGSPERALYLQWFHYGEASLAVHVSQIVRQRFGRPPEQLVQAALDESRRSFVAAAEVVERELRDKPFIGGDNFSAADIMVSYGLIMARITRELPDTFTNIAAYLERLKQRPSYTKAWG